MSANPHPTPRSRVPADKSAGVLTEGGHQTRQPNALVHLALISCAALLVGCATVKPWQREKLADPIMQQDRNPMSSALLDHIYFSREAASGGRIVGGGGCGCN